MFIFSHYFNLRYALPWLGFAMVAMVSAKFDHFYVFKMKSCLKIQNNEWTTLLIALTTLITIYLT